jgi:RNA polymerase sigma-32 factor
VRNLPVRAGTSALANVSPLQLYLQEIAKYPLLEPEEEFELARKHFEEADVTSAHRLITSNLRLVVKIANDFRTAQVTLLDLIQEGNYGLMQAVKKFNPYKGVKLSSYAAWWIRAYILKYLMEQKSQVKIATTAAQRKLFYNLQKETDRLLLEYDTVDPKQIAASLDVTEKDVIEMQKRLRAPDFSLDAPVDVNGEDGGFRGSFLVDPQAEAVDDVLAAKQIQELFSTYLQEFQGQLAGRDREIFDKRLLAETPLTLQEIGDLYGFSRERARQVEARILQRLKEFVLQKGTLDV